MKRKGAAKGNIKAKTTTKPTVKAKSVTGRTGANAGFLKVPSGLQKTLTAKAEADASFKGKNWQKYAINCLKEAAGT